MKKAFCILTIAIFIGLNIYGIENSKRACNDTHDYVSLKLYQKSQSELTKKNKQISLLQKMITVSGNK